MVRPALEEHEVREEHDRDHSHDRGHDTPYDVEHGAAEAEDAADALLLDRSTDAVDDLVLVLEPSEGPRP